MLASRAKRNPSLSPSKMRMENFMATPKEAVICPNHPKESPSAPSMTPRTTMCSSSLKQVLLHDWWLIKCDSDCHGKRLGIGGFTCKGGQGIRSFCSAPIVMRHDAVTLKTIDGITVLVHGYLNRPRTLENGFSSEVCENFQIGFPYYWDEFAAISDGEEDHGANMIVRDIFDDILRTNHDDALHCSEASSEKKENSPMAKSTDSPSTPDETFLDHKKMNSEQKPRTRSNSKDLKRSGPVTRSRARVLRTSTNMSF
ncbi:hypothetical protein OROGR_007833 [Orobanche gracilis]